MRELGLVTIFWDVNVSSVGKAFDPSGQLVDEQEPGLLASVAVGVVREARCPVVLVRRDSAPVARYGV